MMQNNSMLVFLLLFLVSCLFQQCVCRRIFSRTAEVVWSFPQHMMQNISMLLFVVVVVLPCFLFASTMCLPKDIFSNCRSCLVVSPAHNAKQLNALVCLLFVVFVLPCFLFVSTMCLPKNIFSNCRSCL